jgi:hypothetical protein
VRIFLSVAALLLAAACSLGAPPGRLALSNYNYERVRIEAEVTANPDCAARDAAIAVSDFDLPFNATHVVEAVPGADICWRIVPGTMPGGPWTQWNRVFTASGRAIDSRI